MKTQKKENPIYKKKLDIPHIFLNKAETKQRGKALLSFFFVSNIYKQDKQAKTLF
jgi:hypothetical protein